MITNEDIYIPIIFHLLVQPYLKGVGPNILNQVSLSVRCSTTSRNLKRQKEAKKNPIYRKNNRLTKEIRNRLAKNKFPLILLPIQKR
jgi:hypothetical protein